MILLSSSIIAQLMCLPLALAQDTYRLVSRAQNNTLSNQYTLTAYASHNTTLNGLKINWGGALNLFQANVSTYCPFVGNQSSLCPNGTDTVFVGTLYPDSEVPGGQDLYVNVDGLISITVQHSHSFPPGSWPEYYGWTWTPLLKPTGQTAKQLPGCPRNNDLYNCDIPSGYFDFKAPNATRGGVMACPNEYNTNVTSVYAVTPEFNRTGCVELVGMGTHNYTGPTPPVWSY
ncbi:hypothetical protein NA57DRAFT_70464 [Rhizodiscina lignyota]|uniref:Uncharacterized protein n=1 Tax=Rhizodiscina lignyota TaxID=1504668 RepID=A0A9P4MAP5_9PEZI|nr:hypothetical protein NA57DRAFT_70464 [Rhizodiscina lignyota]